MSIVILVGVILLVFLFFSRKDATMIKIVLGLVELLLLVLCYFGYTRQDDLFLKIPGTRIESASTISVPNTGSFYVESSQSAMLDNKFYISDGSSSDLYDWLSDTSKNVFLYIVDGNKTVYSRNLGLYDEDMAADIMRTYNSWKAEGVVPAGHATYWWYCFYFEV